MAVLLQEVGALFKRGSGARRLPGGRGEDARHAAVEAHLQRDRPAAMRRGTQGDTQGLRRLFVVAQVHEFSRLFDVSHPAHGSEDKDARLRVSPSHIARSHRGPCQGGRERG